MSDSTAQTLEAPPAPAPDTAVTPFAFAELPLRPELLQALAGLGYEEPTPIQREAIPPLVEGRDLLGQAATGTGKTAAFALPLLHRISGGTRGSAPSALVLVPTRELAMQVSEAVIRYGKDLGARVLPVYGGTPVRGQVVALKKGIDVVVATPGRALDLIGRGTLVTQHLGVVVLDEADEMLDMGFAEDIEAILKATPAQRQTVLFSATMPPRIDGMARRHLNDPVRVVLGRSVEVEGDIPLVRQVAYVVPRAHKPAALTRILDVEAPEAAIVFCRTRDEVDDLTDTLNSRGHRAEALHGGIDQGQRERVMGRLRSGATELLVATDVAARGIDVDQLTHVINYDVPAAPEAYVHRIGRVGRAGREGVAITLVQPREHRMIKNIERLTRQPIAVDKVPTVKDLRARRLEKTTAALREAITAGELDPYRRAVATLAGEFGLEEVALAAVKLAHTATGGDPGDEVDVPDAPAPKWEKPARGANGKPNGRPGARERGPAGRAGPGSGPKAGTTRLFVGVGRTAKVRPQDLVGAICGESQLQGRDIGAIEIGDRFSLVEVPEDAADEVVTALRNTTIKGKKATVRRERYDQL